MISAPNNIITYSNIGTDDQLSTWDAYIIITIIVIHRDSDKYASPTPVFCLIVISFFFCSLVVVPCVRYHLYTTSVNYFRFARITIRTTQNSHSEASDRVLTMGRFYTFKSYTRELGQPKQYIMYIRPWRNTAAYNGYCIIYTEWSFNRASLLLRHFVFCLHYAFV